MPSTSTVPFSLTLGSFSQVNPASFSSFTASSVRSIRDNPLPINETLGLYQNPFPSGTVVYMGIATP